MSKLNLGCATLLISVVTTLFTSTWISSAAFASSPLRTQHQISIPRIDAMSDVPGPLKIIDYRKLSLDFDRLVYDFNAADPVTPTHKVWPLIWWDRANDNFHQPTVGIYTTLRDVRQGPQVNEGRFHEALTSMGAVLGATLVGVDKSNQDGLNYVAMLKNYFNRDSGWNILQNNTNPTSGALGGGYARDWWYDVFPNVLFFAIYDKYPNEPQFDVIAKSVADKFYEADRILGGNYDYSFFDYQAMKPMKSWICPQADVAAGHGWVMYAAFQKFKDPKYLAGAKSAMTALSANAVNPSYEVLMPFGALLAARLNAEQGTSFDVEKMLHWSLDGDSVCRQGWGTLVGRWNGYDVSGTVGSVTHNGGYGFLMNTYDQAWPLVAMVRYDTRFANAIGKYMLNAANAARFFYPQYLPAEHQTLPHLAELTKGVIAYEGLIHKTTHTAYENTTVAPVAQGDGPHWTPLNPPISQFSVYGSAHVGIFGALVEETDVAGVLKLDLLATDFFRSSAYPTHLIYNPYAVEKTVSITTPSSKSIDLYDSVSHSFVARKVNGTHKLTLPAKSSVVLVQVPSGAAISENGLKRKANGVVIDYGI